MHPTQYDINDLISGFLMAGNLVVALFFLRFWKRTADRLFLYFAAAFAILGAQRLLLGMSTGNTEDVTHLYALRLVAFLMILWAIIAKNREA
ncbi:MAG TPA: DUF5985 family protein [Candidatus Kapabacteria bacterium]|jgi:hypothetical protein|nr:DUF5985 family protein [Candidatus Kapabacteria bacterium]